MISKKWLPETGSHDDVCVMAWLVGYHDGQRGKPVNCPLKCPAFKREWLDGYELANDERILAALRRPYR